MLRFLTAVSHNETSNFNYIGWYELVLRIEKPKEMESIQYQDAKLYSEVLAANDAPSKRKEDVLKRDNFTLMRVDIDETDESLADIADLLESLGVESFILHTTASHQQQGKGNRYRVYVQIAEPLTFNDWQIAQRYLCYILGADDCSSRPQQIMYLPVLFSGIHYDYKISSGKAYDVKGTQFYRDAQLFNEQLLQEQEKQQRTILTQPAKPAFKEKLIGTQLSVIDTVNQAYDWHSLLRSYGYKQQGKAYLPPEASSNKAGAYILTSNTDGRERYYSHHDSDPCATGQALDKFDLICLRSFDGDEQAAIKGLVKQFPELEKHNKKVYRDYKRSESLQSMLYGRAG